MDNSRKHVTFDLDTTKTGLKIYYPKKNISQAYPDIRKFLLSNGFEWVEGSGYCSLKSMDFAAITELLNNLSVVHPWTIYCVRDFRASNFTSTFDLSHIFHNKRVQTNQPNAQKETIGNQEQTSKKSITLKDFEKAKSQDKIEIAKQIVDQNPELMKFIQTHGMLSNNNHKPNNKLNLENTNQNNKETSNV